MKPKSSFLIIAFLLISSFVSAQNFNVGIENGINFSNIRKSDDYSRFPAQPGPVNGIFVKYDFGNWLTLQSGANHQSLYFNDGSVYYYNYYPDDIWYHSNSIAPPNLTYPVYRSFQGKYSFLRIPLLVKFKTPGRLNFEIGGGAYYAFLTNDEYRGKDRDLYTKEYRDENFPPMNDWGWIMASSVNYDISNKFNLFLNGQITTGNKEYFENEKGKMGATEITFGVGYNPFAKGNNFVRNDSLGKNIRILPHSGINISRTQSTKNSDKYGNTIGFSSGVNLKFLLSNHFSFFTGAWYERKGYSLDYIGHYNFIYKIRTSSANENIPKIYSDTRLDYITFPFGFELSAGKKLRSNFSLGSYYSLLQNVFSEGEKLTTYSGSYQNQVNREYFNDSQDQWFKKTDVGFLLGYRAEFPVFKWGDLFIAAYQSFGVKNIILDLRLRRPAEFTFFNEKMYNNSTTISFGLTIPVSKK
jgi:hypothetical protein